MIKPIKVFFGKLFSKTVNEASEELGEVEEAIHHPLYPIKDYIKKVDDDLIRGSWPEPNKLKMLRAVGIKASINLCSERSQDKDVINAEMLPFNIPIRDNTVPSAEDIKEFLHIVDEHSPVYVHCEAGKGRTGCMVAAYRVLVDKWSPEMALAEALIFGLGVPLQKEFILSLRRK